ncbi:hypothetical protein IGI39_003996 [Enterococcus sp. AZ135]|uniref:putative minor capsid protein n=1 Tax=unclassified Enterococcus TaxID=2608891 RepID=UPI003F209EF3
MLVQKPPIETLVEEMVHRSYLGEGDYNKPLYGKYEPIRHVRIDRKPKYMFDSKGEKILWNATVFCYAGLTDPLPAFKEKDALIFDGIEHKIVSAAMFKEPYVDQIYSYELGAI